jgi:hypothetical protein
MQFAGAALHGPHPPTLGISGYACLMLAGVVSGSMSDDEPQDIEERRGQLYLAELDARAAYAKEAPTGTSPLTGPVLGGPLALRLKELQDKVQAAMDARKAFDEEYPIERRIPRIEPT